MKSTSKKVFIVWTRDGKYEIEADYFTEATSGVIFSKYGDVNSIAVGFVPFSSLMFIQESNKNE